MGEKTYEVTTYVTIRAENAADAEGFVREMLESEPEIERVAITTVRTLRRPVDAC